MTEENRGEVGSQPEVSDAVGILDYLEVVLLGKKAILCITSAAFILSTIISFNLPVIYNSTAKIVPPQPDQGLMGMVMGQMGGMGGIAGDLLGKGNSTDMYVSMLETDAMSDAIIDRFDLMRVYDQKYRYDTYKELAGNVDIAAGKKDGIISITVEDTDPKRAAAIANAYVEELGRAAVRLSTGSAGQNRRFFEERLAKAKGDLARAEDALKAFQAKSKMISVTEQAEATVGGIAQIKAQLVAQESQLAVLQRQFTDSTAEVKSAKAAIAGLRRELAVLEGGGSGGAIPGIGSVPELGQQYLRVMREFKTQEAIVELLTKQYELVRLNEEKDVDGVQLIQKARVADKKAKPKRVALILAATFAGFFLAVMYTLAREAGKRAPEQERQRWQRIVQRLLSFS
jgi:tyrosine-protein kinase Etk/Wzc